MANFRGTSSTIALTALGLATPAWAQDQTGDVAAANSGVLGEVIVTAQRRAERQVDVPITVTTLSTQQLEAAGANQLSDIARVSPALRFDTASSFVQPTIRGVGTAVTTSGGGANVGIYVDGFYSPNPLAANFELMKLESVQVLKGPQGTLFGRNTTGGAILVTTADPSTETVAEVKASYGRFNTQTYQAYATAGMGEKVAFDIEGLYRTSDGFVHNITTGSDRDGEYENWSARVGMKVDVSDAVSLLLRYSHTDQDDPTGVTTRMYSGPIYNGPAYDPRLTPDPGVGTNLPATLYTTNPDQVASSFPSETFTKADAAQMTIKADLGFADLTSYTQYREEDSSVPVDLDHTSANIIFLHIDVLDETWSQEVLLTSKPGGKLQWTTGLFFFSNMDQYKTYLGVPTAANPLARLRFQGSSTTTESAAVFADFTYELTPQLFLTAGGRFAHDVVKDAYYNVSVGPPGTEPGKAFVPDLKGDKFTPRVVLRYKPNDSSSIYASFTKGYKAGILDVGGGTGARVNPEDIAAFEVGYKYDDRRLSGGLSAYYYDYKDLQVSLYLDNRAKLLNAASSRIYGLEGQIRYKFDAPFEVNAGAAYTHAMYKRFDNAPVYKRCDGVAVICSPGNSFLVFSDNPATPANEGVTLFDVTMQRTPEFTGNIGASYTVDLAGGELAFSGNLYYTSKFNFGPSGIQFPQDAYEVLGLRAEWTDSSDRYSIAAYGDNLTDNRYLTQVSYTTFGVGSIYSSPRAYGIQVGAKF